MYFEFLIEDQTGSIFLEKILPRILGENNTENYWRIKSYKGIGAIPSGIKEAVEIKKRSFLRIFPAF